MNRTISLILLALCFAVSAPAQEATNTSKETEGKPIRRQADASPTTLDFGDQVVQTIGKELMVTLTNNTDKPLEITSFDTDVDGEDFVFDYDFDECRGAAIDVGKSCKVRIVFYPLLPGERRSFLLVTYDDPDHPQKIALRGKSIDANR